MKITRKQLRRIIRETTYDYFSNHTVSGHDPEHHTNARDLVEWVLSRVLVGPHIYRPEISSVEKLMDRLPPVDMLMGVYVWGAISAQDAPDFRPGKVAESYASDALTQLGEPLPDPEQMYDTADGETHLVFNALDDAFPD